MINYDAIGTSRNTLYVGGTVQGVQLRKFKYDDLGRLTRQKLAEQTATLNDSGVYIGAGQTGANWSNTFFYDSRSNLTQKTDARGVKANYFYEFWGGGGQDPLNRLQWMSYDHSGPMDTSVPIYASQPSFYIYMTTGDKTRIQRINTQAILDEEFTYDAEGRVSENKKTVAYRANHPFTTSYLYDTLDRVKEVHYPEQYGPLGGTRKIVAHTYDTASRLTGMTYGGQQAASDIVYNASDQTTQIKIGPVNPNQVTENYTFDAQTGLLTNQNATMNGNPLLNLSYEYNRGNSAGSLNGKTGHLTKIINNLDTQKNREYEFDAVGRLTKAKGGPNGNLWNQQYSYDRYGNRMNVTKSGVAADGSPIPLDGIPNLPTLTYNNENNRITTAGFQYDVNGNQTRAPAEDGVMWVKYEYDSANRLRRVRKDDTNQTLLQEFEYASDNARLLSFDPVANRWSTYASAGGTTLAEYTELTPTVPTWTKSYTYLGDSQLATITPNGQNEHIEFNHPDRLGTRTITNQAGGTSYEQNTLPFGTALNAESTVQNNNKRFTSYDRSEKTGLDYAVNRTYDSKQGRFTQVDPIGMSAVSLASPQTLNMYTYCGNDPINYTDPSGLFWGFFKKLFKWILVAVAVIVAILAIIAVVTAPFTIAGLLGAISAGTGAASSVLGALGYAKAARIFGLIAVVTGFGSLIAGKTGFGTPLVEGADEAVKLARDAALTGIFAGVGSITNALSRQYRSETQDDPIIFDRTFTAILDAFRVLRSDLKCAKLFGLLDKRGKFSEAKFKQLTRDVTFSANPKTSGPMAQTVGKNISLNGGFYQDGRFILSPQPYSIKNPRQGRAQTVLHELGHVKGILISPDNAGLPNSTTSPGNQNEKTIRDNCRKGLSQIASSY